MKLLFFFSSVSCSLSSFLPGIFTINRCSALQSICNLSLEYEKKNISFHQKYLVVDLKPHKLVSIVYDSTEMQFKPFSLKTDISITQMLSFMQKVYAQFSNLILKLDAIVQSCYYKFSTGHQNSDTKTPYTNVFA